MHLHNQITPLPAETVVFPKHWTPITDQYRQAEMRAKLMEQRSGITYFDIGFIRRHNRFLVSIPPGTFAIGFSSTAFEEIEAIRKAILPLKRMRLKIAPRLRPFVQRAGDPALYVRRELLQMLAEEQPNNELLQALLEYHTLVELNWRDIFKTRDERPFTPFEERRARNAGRLTRGADWSPAEDAILERFFLPNPETGKRIHMTEQLWARLLSDLKERRTRRSILARLSVRNTELKRTLMVDGYLTDEGVQRYKRLKLGQRTRVPNYRPRLHGDYHGNGSTA